MKTTVLGAVLAMASMAWQTDQPTVTELAAKCGSEIQWMGDLEQAKTKAREQKRLILWYISKVTKSSGLRGPMYKAHVLDRYMQEGPFMDDALVRLINQKFIPFTLPHKEALSEVSDLAKELNLVRFEFIEPGFVIMRPDGKVVHKIDKIRTFDGEFLARVMQSVLDKNPDWNAPGANSALEKRAAKDAKTSQGDRLVDEALKAQKLGKFSEAETMYARAVKDHPTCSRHAEAHYRLGAILYGTGRDDEAQRLWRELVDKRPDSRWAWKAAAELSGPGPSGHGPFVHGYEPLTSVLEPAGTDLPDDTMRPTRLEKEIDKAVGDAIDYLLRMQRPDGMWKDSQYDFMGKQHIPNTWMAITAISANALRVWKDRDPRIPKALEKAEAVLLDSTRLSETKIERSYAQAYRLIYFVRRTREAPEPEKKKYAKIMSSLAEALQKEQLSNGFWMHEYGNPFVTTTVLTALYEARQAGVEISKETVEKGLEALKKSRGKDGTFAYEKGAGANVNQAAGRMPQCEMALYLYGASTMSDLEKAVEAFFKYRINLERVRLYDYHADQFGNGGFFFYYDYHGATEAIRLLKPELQKKNFAELRRFLLGVQEIDGSFIDDHELGKSYGTAFALLMLKNCASQ